MFFIFQKYRFCVISILLKQSVVLSSQNFAMSVIYRFLPLALFYVDVSKSRLSHLCLISEGSSDPSAHVRGQVIQVQNCILNKNYLVKKQSKVQNITFNMNYFLLCLNQLQKVFSKLYKFCFKNVLRGQLIQEPFSTNKVLT